MGSIVIRNLGKAYVRYPSRWARLREWLTPGGNVYERHWVLRGIDLDIVAGEAVGIVGANGAGKSTLLKMVTGTTSPTEGTIDIQGHVAALLELGMGFHPEFTGRQNVFMAGQLLGLQVDEIAALMPFIEDFAEIGDAIDQPVRTYSSGMQVRLAFSVATARKPDVLIVDEALSVGDAYFQHKSFDRIRQLRAAGTTLLIVTHDRYAVQSICDRAVLLADGKVAMQGDPENVLDYYNALIARKEGTLIKQHALSDGSMQTISGTGEASIVSARLLNLQGEVVTAMEVAAPVVLEVRVRANVAVDRLVLGYLIKDRFGQSINGINTHRLDRALEHLAAGEELIYRFGFAMSLGKGNYSIAFSLSRDDSHVDTNFEWRDRGLIFQVVNSQRENFVGCTWLESRLEIERVPVAAANLRSQQ
jgi:lipopolysaccharide transport system ATP-binding protein